MILSAGLSPAWQRVMVFEVLRSGEVNRAQRVLQFASGKVLNVAIGLKHLGCDVNCLSPVGGTPSSAIRDEFSELQITSHWIETGSATRTCLTLLDSVDDRTTELVENAEPIDEEELASWASKFRELSTRSGLIVLSGSVPAGVPKSVFAELMEACDVPFVLDVRNQELLTALPFHPVVIKPNREELSQTVGRELHGTNDVVSAANELRRSGAEWVVITDGPRPVVVVGPEECCQVTVPKISEVVNPIGCGDSMTAGIAAGITEGRSILEAVKWGIACSAQNLGMLLPARLDYEEMVSAADCLTVERL